MCPRFENCETLWNLPVGWRLCFKATAVCEASLMTSLQQLWQLRAFWALQVPLGIAIVMEKPRQNAGPASHPFSDPWSPLAFTPPIIFVRRKHLTIPNIYPSTPGLQGSVVSSHKRWRPEFEDLCALINFHNLYLAQSFTARNTTFFSPIHTDAFTCSWAHSCF